jgi:deoxyribodipyrimidine photolyase
MRDKSIRLHYEDTEWCSKEEEEKRFNAWKKGQTGYPLVDAGMRELYKTGWMTQSVRMIVASFLVEYLRVNWVKGCEWFHYTLVDADSAINPMMVS